MGTSVFRVVLFPLAYLVLTIPLSYLVYNAIAFPIKLFVSSSSVGALQALGFSVLQEGNIMIFPSTTLEVAASCSGVRSIISLQALSVALAAVSLKKWWVRITLAVFAVPIAVVVNAARVIITGMRANRYGDRVA